MENSKLYVSQHLPREHPAQGVALEHGPRSNVHVEPATIEAHVEAHVEPALDGRSSETFHVKRVS
jgi:hypothetical protein